MSARRKQLLRHAAILLLIGLAISIGIAWILAAKIHSSQQWSQQEGFEGYENSIRWSVTISRRAGTMLIESQQQRGGDWTPEQATGAPDSPGGDARSAWCPTTPDGQREWLLLEYAQPILAQRVDVYANMGPGTVDRVCAINSAGEEIEVWRGKDPVQIQGDVGVSQIPVSFLFKTNRIRIELDSPGVQGWNEIDAVGLVDENGKTWWATRVTASSTYNQLPTTASYGNVTTHLPYWSQLTAPSKEFETGSKKVNHRIEVAHGWPMLAMHGDASGLLPLRPVWDGLAVDSLLFGGLCGIAWWLLVVPRRFIAEARRMHRGACLKCGYDLRYDFAGGCPECGWRRDIPLEQRRIFRQDNAPQ